MSLYLHFFAITLVNDLFDNPVLFENFEKNFLFDIMTRN